MVKIVVQYGDERRIEGEVLLEGARALHLENDARDAVVEEDVRAVGFFRLGAPVVTDGRAIGLQRQRAGDFAGGAVGRLDLRGAFGEPAAAGRRNLKFLVADGLAAEFNGELALVLNKDNGIGRWRGLFLSSEGQRGTRHDSQCQCDRTYSEFHSASYPRVHSLSRQRFLNYQMRGVSTGCNNAAAQNFRDDLCGFAGAVPAIIGKLIGRETLG